MHTGSCKTEEIPFGAVISITNRGKDMFVNDRLKSLGLTCGQVPVLMLLAKEQNITQETLVRHYHLDKGTIARAVKKLEDAGYIRRITDPKSRRAVRLFLTEKGEGAIPVILTINREWETWICRGLLPQDKKAVRTMMQTVAKNSFSYMKRAGGHPDDSE